ncbi:MAG TPA: hypothetical protein VGG85_02415 [Terracidiphilus sp.]
MQYRSRADGGGGGATRSILVAETTTMIVIGIILGAFSIGLLCWLLFALAVYALLYLKTSRLD